MYDSHVQLGGRIVPFAGWEMPVQYTGIVDEHQAVRTAAGLFDASHMGELSLTGEYARAGHRLRHHRRRLQAHRRPGALHLRAERGRQDPRRSHHLPRRRGALAGRLQRVQPREDGRRLLPRRANHCDFSDKSDETALIALQGPKAFAILAQMGRDAAGLAELKSFHFRDAVVGNVRATVARTGYTGEDGVEIFCAWSDAKALWDQLIEVGRPARPQAGGSRRAGHVAARSAPVALRQRDRRDDQPVRGRSRPGS